MGRREEGQRYSVKNSLALYSGIGLILTLALVGCSDQYHMINWPHPMHHGLGGIFMWILFLVLVVVIIYIVLRNARGKGVSGQKEDALEILKRRYASGEISKEQYEEMRKDLEGR